MRRIASIVCLSLLAGCASSTGPASPGSTEAPPTIAGALATADPAVRRYDQHVTTLANPFFGGRLPGTPGIGHAEDYIVDWFERLGLEPAFGGAYRQPFEVRLGSRFRSAGAGEVVTANNTGAILRGSGALADEFIVVGGHHDHLGRGRYGSREGEGKLHLGADDNASGTAGVLLLAEQLSARYAEQALANRRSVLFLTFSAEETGLSGSRHYVENPIAPLEQHVMMVNFDMIGRAENGRINIHGMASGEGLMGRVVRSVEVTPLDVTLDERLPARSDHMSFYDVEIPVLFAIISEIHEDYHTSGDVSWKINREAAAETVAIFVDLVDEMTAEDTRYAFKVIEGAAVATDGPSMTDLKVRFGIKPASYTDPDPGVGVQRVTEGTSAEAGGVLAGDRLMTWNGKPIEDVGGWMRLMLPHEAGDVVRVGVDRDGERVELMIKLYPRLLEEQDEE